MQKNWMVVVKPLIATGLPVLYRKGRRRARRLQLPLSLFLRFLEDQVKWEPREIKSERRHRRQKAQGRWRAYKRRLETSKAPKPGGDVVGSFQMLLVVLSRAERSGNPFLWGLHIPYEWPSNKNEPGRRKKVSQTGRGNEWKKDPCYQELRETVRKITWELE